MKTLITILCLAAAGWGQQRVVPPEAAAAESAGVRRAGVATFSISYVKSDRRWRYGPRSEPYNKISEYMQKQLVEALGAKDIRPSNTGPSACCAISLELLDVSIRPAFIKKPGMDVAATVTIYNGDKHAIYSKGYRGESKTVFNTYGHLINHAVENMVQNVLADQSLLDALVNGKL